jgi:hypothetical protein
MTGKPVLAASEREKVLFPDPAIPITRTRRPIAKAASGIDVSVSHMPVGVTRNCTQNGAGLTVVGAPDQTVLSSHLRQWGRNHDLISSPALPA